MYLEPPASRYQLILYADGDLSGCNEELKAAVTGPDQHKADVDAHICEQLKLMAQGLPPTDETQVAASPSVAAAYIAASARNEVAIGAAGRLPRPRPVHARRRVATPRRHAM